MPRSGEVDFHTSEDGADMVLLPLTARAKQWAKDRAKWLGERRKDGSYAIHSHYGTETIESIRRVGMTVRGPNARRGKPGARPK